MLAAGNQNPDVRLTGSAAPKSGATVKVDAEIENEEDVLRDMRAIRPGDSPRPKQKHPAHAPRPSPGPSVPRHTKTHLARPPAIPAPPPCLGFPARHPRQSPAALAEVPRLAFQSSCLLLATMQVIAFRGGRWRARKSVENSRNGLQSICTPFHILGAKTAFSEPESALARRKCTIHGALVPELV